jgi:Protein of unknown function (DUF2530)
VVVVVTADSLAYVSEQANPSSEDVSPRHPAETARLRPAPPPLEVNTFTVVLIGEVLWLVAFLAVLPFRDGHRIWWETCLAGFGLGLIGLFLTRHRRPRRRS